MTSTLAPTSPVITSTASSSDVGQTSAMCPRPLQWLKVLRAVGPYMAFLATSPVAPPHWGATFGGFGAAAITTGSRGRATTDLVGAFTASSLPSSQHVPFKHAVGPTFMSRNLISSPGLETLVCSQGQSLDVLTALRSDEMIKQVFCMLSSSSRLVNHFVILVALLGKRSTQSSEPKT